MALSNMGKEPRREIIETVIGGVLVIGLFTLDYHAASWLAPREPRFLGMMLGLLLFMMGSAMIFLLAIATHALGEVVCAGLARVGCDPRPKDRYR